MERFLYRKYYRHQMVVNTVFVVCLASVLFVYPFGNHFRVTLGVVAISTSLLYFGRLPIGPTSAWCAAGIFLTRLAVDAFSGQYALLQTASHTLPASAYYISFGVCFKLLDIRGSVGNAQATLWKLSFGDLFSNLVELAFRNGFAAGYPYMLPELAAIAALRALLTIYGYYLLRRYRAFVLAEEHFGRYSRLILIFAELKMELYYLKKSSQDMESIMARSYRLYQALAGLPDAAAEKSALRVEALTVAKDIHEIKNDYYRVVAGMEGIMEVSGRESGMRMKEIFRIIEKNTLRVLEADGRKIQVRFAWRDDFLTTAHYTIVSVLNNLLINALEACGEGGVVSVTERLDGGRVEFTVEDNGCGIDAADLDMIFQPGFSTKYSPLTGEMSTGLGLAHVKTLLDMYGGAVKVASAPQAGAKFTVSFCYDAIAVSADVGPGNKKQPDG